MKIIKPHATKHYRARFKTWSLAMLAWLAWVFRSDRAPSRRHMRQRYGFMSLNGLALNIALLIMMRAGELLGRRRRSANPFFGRIRGRMCWPRHAVRSVIGGRLRRALQHRDFTTRVAILTHALRHLDDWARAHMKRLRRGVTKRWPIRTKRDAMRAPLVMLAAMPVAFADSS